MIIACPHCGKSYQLAPEYTGKTVTCPECQHSFVAENPNLTPCPDCFAPVSRRAETCPHCGAPLKMSQALSRMTQSEDATETEVDEYHPSPKYYILNIGLGILLLPVLIGIFILIDAYISIHFTVYTLTSKRIIVKTGWLNKHQTEIWIKDMRGVNLSQDLISRILGLANVSIGTAATAGAEIQMHGLANAQDIVDKINSLRHQ